jgi:ADP-heptose:LPS heptosyltransferase
MNSGDSTSNVVIFRIGSIGDTIVALPCFHAIARTFPRHRRILLTNTVDSTRQSSVETLLHGTRLVHETLHFPAGGGSLRCSMALARQLRRLNPEVLVHLTPRTTALQVYRDLLFFRTAGVRNIIGAPLTVGMRECNVDPATGALEHEAERLARILAPRIAVDLDSPGWQLRLSPAEQGTAERWLSELPPWCPIVAVSPGARVPAKDWGEDRWEALIGLMRQRLPAVSLVFVGAPDERMLVERLSAQWTGAKLNLCGKLTPRESAAVLGRCHLLLCHDSGPMHLAASQGTRCIALFGNFNRPRQWFPYGADHTVIHQADGVRAISVEQVTEAVEVAVLSLQGDVAPRLDWADAAR